MRIPLTESEAATARELAAELGVTEEAMIEHGEEVKGASYAQAARAAQASVDRIGGVGNQMMGGPHAEVAGEPVAEAG